MHNLWQAFGWSQATKKKLPNKDLRKGDVLLKELGGSGWSTMVQSILAAVVRCAEILYPANSDSLLEEVAARLSQSSSSITTKDENKVTENTIMIMNASQKRSIPRARFYEILRNITAGGEKMLCAVDYVTGVLVNDQVTLLQRIVDDIVGAEKKPVLTNYITIMRIFLKQQYDSHALTQGDEVGTHGIDYGLCKPDLSVPARTGRCNGCNFVHFCISELQESVAAADALEVIKDAAEKLELYRGHRVRVTNQQVHLEKIIKDMGKKCLENKRSSEALVVAD